jgi:hypothetical protein
VSKHAHVQPSGLASLVLIVCDSLPRKGVIWSRTKLNSWYQFVAHTTQNTKEFESNQYLIVPKIFIIETTAANTFPM